jgi:crotonobetainyl-CoA:carnitine CoA-transferase CaiB-like acyl-CoA transferase
VLPLLTDIRVIEIANTIAPAYAGRLLADLGAEVIAVEPPDGNRLRRSTHLAPNLVDYLTTNKRTVCIDYEAAQDERLAASLFQAASIVLYDRTVPYFDHHWLDEGMYRRSPTVLSVITPYGLRSPYQDLHGDELLLFALSGIASVTPEEPADRALERPMQLHGHQAAFAGGLTAAVASLQGWYSVSASGDSALLDIAVLDALTSMPIISQAAVFAGHPLPAGPSLRPQTVPRGFLRCKDGYVYTQGGDDNWPGWSRLLGRADWEQPPFSEPAYRRVHWPDLSAVIQRWLGERTSADVYRDCQAAGITAFPVNSIPQVVEHPQMQAREVFQPILRGNTGASFLAPRTPVRLRESMLPTSPDIAPEFGAGTQGVSEWLAELAAGVVSPVGGS